MGVILGVIHFVAEPASARQIEEMLGTFGNYIKVAVDIQKGVLAGGGEFHADCEALLIEKGSAQEDIWGADWFPETKEIRFGALINLRPKQGNRSMDIQNAKIRHRVDIVIRTLLEAK